MADPTPTREETVTANIEAVENKYGDENYGRLMAVCLKDISLSLAMLVDSSSSES
jgi:hypothetical protein